MHTPNLSRLVCLGGSQVSLLCRVGHDIAFVASEFFGYV